MEFHERKQPVLQKNEKILWEGKPEKKAFILERCLRMLPIAIIWLVLDLSIIVPAFGEGDMLFFLVPFFALHLMPVWMWLAQVVTAGRRWRNTAYFVTNRRIIIQHGFFAVNEISLSYKGIPNTQLNIGFIDKIFSVGDISFEPERFNNNKQNSFVFEDLLNPQETYEYIQQLVIDILTDMEYPNAMRPDTNPGYNTDIEP